jgi:hypothetical protein
MSLPNLTDLTVDVNALSDLLGKRFTPDEIADMLDPAYEPPIKHVDRETRRVETARLMALDELGEYDAEILRRAASDLKVLWKALSLKATHDALWDQAQETDAIVRARLLAIADLIDPPEDAS